MRWRKYNLGELFAKVDAARAEQATEDAHKHEPKPLYSELTYTEQNPQWTLLYDHSRGGQIEPKHLRRMRGRDLEYLAGSAHIGMDKDEAAKLQGNITRATRELQRRYAVRAGLFLALFAALLGVGAKFLG